MNKTFLEDLIDPQVIGAGVEEKIQESLKVKDIVVIDNTLEGRPGSKLTAPVTKYIGAAEEVAEGEKIPLSKLQQKTVEYKVKKVAKGVSLTDEAVLSGHGDPIGTAEKQLAISIADVIDKDAISELGKATQKISGELNLQTLVNLVDMVDVDGYEDREVSIVLNKQDLTTLKQELIERQTVKGDTLISNNVLESLLGGRIIPSKHVKKGNVYVARKGALKLILKRDTFIEPDRDAETKSTNLYADKHYGLYLVQDELAAQLNVKAEATK